MISLLTQGNQFQGNQDFKIMKISNTKGHMTKNL